jgi:hypothetical protein
MNIKKRVLAAAVLGTLALGANYAQASEVAAYQAVSSTGGNFTMLTHAVSTTTPGYAFGGTNNVIFTWTGTLFNSNSDYTGLGSASNATISSTTGFFGPTWTAHDLQLFSAGTYTFDSTIGGGNNEAGTVTMTVGANQIGAHMLFNWNGNNNIDVVNVWNFNSTFSNCGSTGGSTGYNCLWTGASNPQGNTANTVWLFASTDNDGDGTLGVPMAAGGPFGNYNANFNLKGASLTPIPIPAAAWLFGSGLMGLVGFMRKRTTS